MKLIPIKFVEVAENKAILTLQLQSNEKIPVITFDVDYSIEEDSESKMSCGDAITRIDGKEVILEIDWCIGETTSLASDFDRRNGGV